MYVGNVPLPNPEKDEVLVKMEATAVNRADTLQWKGQYPPPKGASDIIGLECSGYILNSLEEYKEKTYKKNKRVMALLSGGGYADVVWVHKDHLIEIPEGLSFEEAAAIPETWLTAYQLLKFVGWAKEGDTVLIHAAASGVGTAAIQLCKLLKLTAISSASSSSKLEFVRKLGS